MPSLSNVFTQENIKKLLEDPEIRQQLLPELPSGQQHDENLLENLVSPQF